MTEISLATEDDVPELNLLINSAYRGEASREGWTTEADFLEGIRTDEESLKSIMNRTHTFFLKFTEDEKILGSVFLEKRNEILYLGMLTVSPGWQSRGIGKLLMRAGEEKAKELDCQKIEMNVISLRKELISWYLRQGYIDTGKKRAFPVDEKF